MAHEISNVSGRDECFTAGERPWHGLGVNVKDRVTAKDAILLAGLNWKVEQMKTLFFDGIHPWPIDDKVANIRRKPNGEPVYLGTVGVGYKPIQNEVAFDFFDKVVGEKLAIYETAGAIRNGTRVWILAKLPGDLIIKAPGGEDNTERYLLFVNGHDGSFGCRMFFTPVRVVCANTMTAALGIVGNEEGIFIKHVGEVEAKIEEAVRVLKIANVHYQNLAVAFNHFAQFSFTEEDAKRFFEQVIPVDLGLGEKKQANDGERRELMLDNFLHGKGSDLSRKSLWGGYNAVTEFADHTRYTLHEPKTENSRFELSPHRSVLWGDSKKLKQRAFNVASIISDLSRVLKAEAV